MSPMPSAAAASSASHAAAPALPPAPAPPPAPVAPPSPLSLDASDIIPAARVQMSPEPGTTQWDAVIRFPDGFELAIDRWPVPSYKGPIPITVPPQKIRFEGYIGGVRMFSATLNLVGGTNVVKKA